GRGPNALPRRLLPTGLVVCVGLLASASGPGPAHRGCLGATVLLPSAVARFSPPGATARSPRRTGQRRCAIDSARPGRWDQYPPAGGRGEDFDGEMTGMVISH